MLKKFFKKGGFTLFELLAVLAIMAIVAGIAVPRVMQTIKNARIEALKNNIQLVANAVQRYVTEKELSSDLGGMFVINPTVTETQKEGAGVFKYDSVSVQNKDGFPSIFNVSIDDETNDVPDANSRAKDIETNYLEGGIPPYIRVIVYSDKDEQGHIVVSYGNVDATPDHDGQDDVLLLNGITPEDLGITTTNTPYTVEKTFDFFSTDSHLTSP